MSKHNFTIYYHHYCTMNSSPGDIIVYEAPFADRSTTNKFAMNVPVDVMHYTSQVEMGLALILDTTTNTSAHSSAIASPPLLGTRLSPRRPSPQSLSSEYAPMRTPSPSLRGQSNTLAFTLYVPTPAVSSLPPTPGEHTYGCIPASMAVSEGLNLLALPDADEEMGLGLGLPGYDENDLITVVPGCNDSSHTNLVGLGIGFAGWDDDDLITIVPAETNPLYSPTIPTCARVGLGFDFAEFDNMIDTLIVDELDDADYDYDYDYDSPLPAYYHLLMGTAGRALHYPAIDDENVSTPDSMSSLSSSSISSPAAFGPAEHEYVPHYSAQEAIGLGIYEADGTLLEMGIVESPANITSQTPEPDSGSNLPYWGTYAVRAVREEEFIRKESRMKLFSRLPIIEEAIVESPQ